MSIFDFHAISYQDAKTILEKYYLERVMTNFKYNQSKAAKALGMSRGTLRHKLKEHFGNKYFRDVE